MPTQREMLRLGGHPFFERMRTLRQLFASFEQAEDERSGTYQDAEIELRFRASTGNVGEYEPDALIEFRIETSIMQTMHRLCQIVLLYSTFESFCSGTLRAESDWQIAEGLVTRSSNKAKKDGKNFVLTILEEAEKAGMQSSAWPSQRFHVEVFVAMRIHLVHHGLEVNDRLRKKLSSFVGNIGEIPGSSANEKLQYLGDHGSLMQIPRAFVSRLFELVEDLAAALVVPVDRKAPRAAPDSFTLPALDRKRSGLSNSQELRRTTATRLSETRFRAGAAMKRGNN